MHSESITVSSVIRLCLCCFKLKSAKVQCVKLFYKIKCKSQNNSVLKFPKSWQFIKIKQEVHFAFSFAILIFIHPTDYMGDFKKSHLPHAHRLYPHFFSALTCISTTSKHQGLCLIKKIKRNSSYFSSPNISLHLDLQTIQMSNPLSSLGLTKQQADSFPESKAEEVCNTQKKNLMCLKASLSTGTHRERG